jgi:hypothetical protein
MERLSHARAAICFRLRPAPVRGALAGGIFLSLALVVSVLLLFPPTVSTPVPPAKPGQAAAISPFQIRPRRTPRPTPTPTRTPQLTPTQSPTVAPNPTALPTGTATDAGTLDSSAQTGETSGSGKGGAQPAKFSPGILLGWGAGMLALVAFSVFILLFARRASLAERQLLSAPHTQQPTRARLNQLRQLLPGRQAALPMSAEITKLPLEEDQDWEALPPLQGTPSLAPLKPPRWLIEAGLITADTGEWSAADQQASGRGENASTDEPQK